MKESYSQEFLDAFVDDELADAEREHALRLLDVDTEFRQAVCERRTLKEMVSAAYAMPPRDEAGTGHGPSRHWRQAAVAGLCLALGLGGGWLLRDRQAMPGEPAVLAGLPEGYRAVSLTERVDPNRIVLHLDSGEPSRLAAGLDLAAGLLESHGPDARVEVVVNSYGLDLLSERGPYREAVERLARAHANLSLVACGQTIARLKREGVSVSLIPEAAVATSAINEITTRMASGWVYVKV
jgi:intracellular sulfur oxidation DsrE/DsrF family protein